MSGPAARSCSGWSTKRATPSRSIYRLTDPDAPLGVDPGVHPTRLTLLPQPATGREPNWFAVPDGAVGRFEDAVVESK